MVDHRDPNKVAEELADFTDRILAGEKSVETATQGADRDSVKLQETVVSLCRNTPPGEPDSILQNRVRSRLAAEWKISGPQPLEERGGWHSSRQVRRFYAFGSALVVIALSLVAVFEAPRWGVASPGAAQFQRSTVVIILVGVGIIGFIVWWYRRKR
jgi:hypothetical protein